ncbi:MAG: carbohydrate binding domain-containing protein [Phycisphaerae bacterium]
MILTVMVLAGLASMERVSVAGTDYYVSNTGNDSNAGTSPGAPWATMSKVNYFPFVSGDVVHFERGGIWRDTLVPPWVAGTYTAYGTGNKPQILGSREMNDPNSWINEGSNIWRVAIPTVTGSELLPNPSFDTNTANWSCYATSTTGTRDTAVYYTSPASYKIACTNHGTNPTDVQVYTYPLSITYGKQYKLTFRAKCTSSFTIPGVYLLNGSGQYAFIPNPPHSTNSSPTITTDWATYTIYYEASVTATDARIDFFLGGGIPDNSTMWIDTLSLKELSGTALIENIGNIIFNNATCGTRQWMLSDLHRQKDFWYDADNVTVHVYSTQNPATLYNDIELARAIVSVYAVNKSYITLDNLSIAYVGINGIELGSHMTVTNCDVSYIGGSGTSGRYGNAIELWMGGHDITVEHCHIWQVYDAAITNQGQTDTNSQYNLYFRYNTIEDCGMAYELWDRPEYSTMYNIHFDNNTCRNAGGWSQGQRPDAASGVFLKIHNSSAAINGPITITNNIFDNASLVAFNMLLPRIPWNDLDNITIDNNTYYSPNPSLVLVNWDDNVSYYSTAADFAQYKADTGKDIHSRLNPCGALSGKAVLGDYTGDTQAIGALIELRQGGSVVKTVPQLLDTNGNFSVSDIKPGTYDVAIKVYGHQRKVLTGIVFVDPATTDIGTVTLTAGDTNGDNAITSVDLMTVLANMDQSGN